MRLIFEIYKDKAGEWRWRAKAKNGKKIGDGYTRKHGCLRALWKFMDDLEADLKSPDPLDIREIK